MKLQKPRCLNCPHMEFDNCGDQYYCCREHPLPVDTGYSETPKTWGDRGLVNIPILAIGLVLFGLGEPYIDHGIVTTTAFTACD